MNWKKIRYGAYAASFAIGLLSAFTPQEDFLFPLGDGAIFAIFAVIAAVTFITFPFWALPFILAIQAINPFSNEKWNEPGHENNPFNLGDPIQFFHFGAWCGLGMFAGTALVSPLGGMHQVVYALLGLIISANMILSVKLCIRIFKNKFTDTTQADPVVVRQ